MKIRTDFVTNSSSSSFIACGVFSEELASFVIDILSGKTRTFSEYQVGELEVSGNIVSVTTTLDYGDFYIHDILGDFDKRTNDEREADDEEANTPDTILTALSAFLPIQTEEQGERLEKLLKEAADRGDTLASVYMDQTDGFEARQFFAHDFSSGQTKGKLPPRKAETNPWLQKYGQWVVENPKIEFAGKIFVFTGLGHNSEKDHPVVSAITQKGGQYRSSVSGRTDCLIVNPEYAGDTKINAVIAQHKKGKNIQVILLQDMERILFPDGSGQVSNKSVLRESAAQKVNTTKRSKQWDNPDEPRVYIGVKSKEFVEFIWEIKGEKCTYLESWEDNIELYIDGDIVTLSEPTDLQGYDWHAWTASELADDHWHLMMSFYLILPVRPSDRWEHLERILERAIATDNVVVRSNYEPEFDREYISQEDFINARLVFEHLTIVACREKENGSTTLVIPSLATVSSKVFQNCKITKHIITEEGFVVLESGAFSHCKSLERLTLVNVGEILRRQLCEGCSSLEEVKLPEGIYRIDERAFSGCVNLEKINIPDTVMFIDPTAFVDCVKLPRDIQEKIRELSDWAAFDGQISETEAYIQDHGEGDYCFDHLNFYKTFPDGMQHGFGRRWSYKELFEKKANIERWHKIHMPYFDEPQNLLKGKVTYTVYANKDVVIDMSAYGWQRQNKFSESVDYLVVDTTNIPSFDRFLYKMRAIDSGAWKTAENFGLNVLEKAIEAKKYGTNIQIVSKAHLELCVAQNAFIEKFTLPTRAERLAAEAQRKREEKAEKTAKIKSKLQQIFDAHASTNEKYFSPYDIYKEFQDLDISAGEILSYVEKTYGISAERYFVENGILASEKERTLREFESVIKKLAQKYSELGKKAVSVKAVVEENPATDVRIITEKSVLLTGKTPREILVENGIIYSDAELMEQQKSVGAEPRNPAEIPENIRKRMDALFAKLDTAYPDKVVVRLHADHKEWGKAVTDLYRTLGYANSNEFLSAYGYRQGVTEDKGGRPKKDPMEIINELKRRYPNGSEFTSVDELKAANPDIASRFQSLRNKSNEYFGMPFTQYLRSIGLIK